MRLLAVAVVLISAFVRAESALEQARSEHKALKFKEAARTLEALATVPGLSRAEATEAYLLEGLVKAALSDAAGAKEAFVRALLRDPGLKLPGRVSPRVNTPYLEAKAVAKEAGPLVVAVPAARRDGRAWSLTWTPSAAVATWVETLAVTVVEDTATREVAFPVAAAKTVEGRGDEVSLAWKALDARGWVVSESTEVISLARPPPELPRVAVFAPTLSAAPPPFPVAPAIIGLSAGGVSAVLGALFLSFSETNARYARTRSTREELDWSIGIGRDQQATGAVFVGVGAALLAAGGVLLGVTVSSRHQVALVPASGGGSVVLAGSWP